MTEENDIQAQPAVLRAVIQITRKATGKVEEYVITGTPTEEPEDPKETEQCQ